MFLYFAYFALSILVLTGLALTYLIVRLRIVRRSPLYNLPGPPFPGWRGNQIQSLLNSATSPKQTEKWVKQYGKSFSVQCVGPFDQRLITVDPIAMSYILNRSTVYEKPWQSRRLIARLIGEGMLAAEGNIHKRQRKVSNPAFSQQNLNAFLPIFFQKAEELRDRLAGHITDKEAGAKVDIAHWISRATFDIIGLTGFDYRFNALQNETNEMYLAYKEMFDIVLNQGQGNMEILGIYFPFLWKWVPTESNLAVLRCLKTIEKTGQRLVQEKKQALDDEDQSRRGKDLLTLLLMSNMSTEIAEDQRISDEDIFNQISTFLFAGSDTSSLTLTWTFFLLSKHPEIQAHLRQELHGLKSQLSDSWIVVDEAPANMPALFSALDKLPLLDMVVRESLRLIPPIHSSLRVATQDDEIPVSEPITMKDGTKRSSIGISKGQFVHVTIESFNLDRDVWGPTAWEFDPYRWLDLPEVAKKQPGIYPNLLSFSAGPRACIGLRFSIMEIKIILYVLLTSLEFSDPDEVIQINRVLVRPFVRGKWKQGSQCPIVIRPC